MITDWVRVVRDDGVPLRYRVRMAGAGEPMLLLHGFTGSGRVWETVSAALSERYRVICPDLLGHGETDAPDDAGLYRLEACASDLVQIARTLGHARFGVLGYSMGGRLALVCAIHQPDAVTWLGLESASPGLMSEEERAARRESDNLLAERLRTGGVDAFVAEWERMALFEGVRRLPEERQAWLRDIRTRQRAEGLVNSLIGMGTGAQASYWAQLGEVMTPTFILTGERDVKFTRIGAEMAVGMQNAVHVLMQGAGHTVHLEQPDGWLAALGEFLAGL